MKELEVLKYFLQFPLSRTKEIFDEFRRDPRAIFRERSPAGKERFLLIPGTRKNKVVLVAHSDTFWDEFYLGYRVDKHVLTQENGFLSAQSCKGEKMILGADDRSGVAILFILKNCGHTILLTDGEEKHQTGSTFLIQNYREIAEFLNDEHQFFIEFDRQNYREIKFYNRVPAAFKQLIEIQTGYKEAIDCNSYTDLSVLCQNLYGVNISTGFYEPHSVEERLNSKEWVYTLNLIKNLLVNEFPKFGLLQHTSS
jgi:hypothetical protein